MTNIKFGAVAQCLAIGPIDMEFLASVRPWHRSAKPALLIRRSALARLAARLICTTQNTAARKSRIK